MSAKKMKKVSVNNVFKIFKIFFAVLPRLLGLCLGPPMRHISSVAGRSVRTQHPQKVARVIAPKIYTTEVQQIARGYRFPRLSSAQESGNFHRIKLVTGLVAGCVLQFKCVGLKLVF